MITCKAELPWVLKMKKLNRDRIVHMHRTKIPIKSIHSWQYFRRKTLKYMLQ